jgi:hypothetical protein
MKSDRFLMWIVGGIGVLVVAAFAVALRQPAPAYKAEDAAEGVAYNYFLALQQGDYARAYGYLSPDLPHYPASVDAFTAGLRRSGGRLEAQSASIQILPGQVIADRTQVTVRETHFASGGLFDSGQYTNTFYVNLRRAADGWRMIHSDSYWDWCWDQTGACS